MSTKEIITSSARSGFAYGIAFTAFNFGVCRLGIKKSLDLGLALFTGISALHLAAHFFTEEGRHIIPYGCVGSEWPMPASKTEYIDERTEESN